MSKAAFSVLCVALMVAVAWADYSEDRKAAADLAKAGKHDAAMAAFLKLAETAASDELKTDAMEQAVQCAVRLKKYDEALETAQRIPLKPNSRYAQMTVLMSQNKWPEVAEQFKDDDIAAWPAALAGKGLRARGLAFSYSKQPQRAEADLLKALDFPLTAGEKGDTFRQIGDIYVTQLKDDAKALEAYRQAQTAGNQYRRGEAARAAAEILVRQGKHDEALAELSKFDLGQFQGEPRALMLRQMADILATQGKKPEAVTKYEEAVKVEGISAGTKTACEKAVQSLQETGK